jgi:hypothetical protein
MDFAYIGYLLFVIPGFCFIWTYRHFTKAAKLGEFEYAAWSLLFGTLLFLIVISLALWNGHSDIAFNPNDPSSTIGSVLGIALGVAITASFPLGFACAGLARSGFFRYVDDSCFKMLQKIFG